MPLRTVRGRVISLGEGRATDVPPVVADTFEEEGELRRELRGVRLIWAGGTRQGLSKLSG